MGGNCIEEVQSWYEGGRRGIGVFIRMAPPLFSLADNRWCQCYFLYNSYVPNDLRYANTHSNIQCYTTHSTNIQS